jgi:hypothetical protein
MNIQVCSSRYYTLCVNTGRRPQGKLPKVVYYPQVIDPSAENYKVDVRAQQCQRHHGYLWPSRARGGSVGGRAGGPVSEEILGGENGNENLLGNVAKMLPSGVESGARLEGFEPTTLGSEDRCSVR